MSQSDVLKLGPYEFTSRLFVGTGKYDTFPLMAEALEAAGCQVVTVAVRRVNLSDKSKESLLDHIDLKRYTLLPNTAGCFTADDAVRTARLGREALGVDWVKLEVLSDPETLLPEPLQTLRALETLIREGFTVLTYCGDDPIMAKRLEEAGSTSVMPLGSPIGSGQGILNPQNIRLIIERAKVPIIVDAGVGTASDTAVAMELGADGVLLNTGIAKARDPVRMARAMRHAVEAGRLAYLAGRIERRPCGTPSSPTAGTIAPAT
ncbi:MAG TPA: thiazole synthase [Phycisphaerae bacterium]|nr:thiazole synthase [Phycisphaerae bacterium]